MLHRLMDLVQGGKEHTAAMEDILDNQEFMEADILMEEHILVMDSTLASATLLIIHTISRRTPIMIISINKTRCS